jgi:hypothetical protein
MATTTKTSSESKIVGALFDDPHDANKAVLDLLKKGYLSHDIAVLHQFDQSKTHNRKHRKEALKTVGYTNSDSAYFDQAITEGKTLVSVTHVPADKAGEVVSIFDHNGAHYNPDGSRNVRDDVVGMTTGAAIGLAGGSFAGPVGAVIGALAGIAVGATVGAVMEQHE